ncbi:tail fiber assembly protein [Pseudomonas saponiphila]|uniref:tail fiber assembly protein n=1 Tax=Pseudomonas saponiphila TaxID=556534 RepID=UPI000B89AB0B|nr:tail fiber assembly protein [Pseudomonas saponiphila]
MIGYAVRNDGQGARMVDGPSAIYESEHYMPLGEELPPEPVPLPPAIEEVKARAIEKRDTLLSVAANLMAPLQDAIDENSATTDEVNRLKLWKQYRITLNRIVQQEGFPSNIDWPLPPQEVA